MKKIYLIILSLAFTFVSVFALKGTYMLIKSVNVNAVSSRKTVVIDAGHGGKDAGTIGIDGTEEKRINLEIALILHDYFTVSGINCLCIREGDYEIYPAGSDRNKSDLYNRLDYINSVPNSVLFSIHQNHYTDESAWGTQVWYSANNAESKEYADLVLSNVKSLLQPENERLNKVSDSSYYLLYKAQVPSIMIECGFMSNREENEMLKSKDYQKKFAYSVLTGICGEI